MNVPEDVGVPLTVIVLDAKDAVTPVGKPEGAPMPVAPVVLNVILVKAVFAQSVGVLDAALTVLLVVTVIVPVAFTVPQPPVKGMV